VINLDKSVRRRNRLPNYDYSTKGYYFVTICSKDRKRIFGSVPNPSENCTVYSDIGFVIEKHIQNISKHYTDVRVDKYIIMPNHIHLIIVIGCSVLNSNESHSLSNIVGLFKSGVSKETGYSFWQRSFHDHVIRTQREYEKIWRYIDVNPALWHKDCFFTNS
jgi:REP element-mobilizing transposase RayT